MRLVARKDGKRVRLWSLNGLDWSADLAAIATALRAVPADTWEALATERETMVQIERDFTLSGNAASTVVTSKPVAG
jgi:hypothetical protein